MALNQQFIDQIYLLVERIERIPVDSIWAHRASGQRGSLFKWIERLQSISSGSDPDLTLKEAKRLAVAIISVYELLGSAAEEIGIC